MPFNDDEGGKTMLGAIYGDLLARPKGELTLAERRERDRRREAVRALLRDIARPSTDEAGGRKAA